LGEPGNFDPSITGFLSYGFNELGVFGSVNLASGNMLATKRTKPTDISRPSLMVAITDVSGSNDPTHTSGDSDAAWLDTVWAGDSGPTYPVTGFNGRVQTVYAKHNNRINVLYVDGHAAPTLASKLTWGQFWEVFEPNVALQTSGTSKISSDYISKPQYDYMEWSSAPE